LSKVGHDSEFPLEHKGRLVSALDVFQEDVYEDECGRYFADNMNCEIAINPVTTEKDFHGYTEHLLDKVRSQGFTLRMVPTAKYPDEALQHPLAYISGCRPDLSAYTGQENKAPDFAEMDSTRSMGAHIHLEHGDEFTSGTWAKWMDAYCTLPLLFRETPSTRRSMYGGAGALRVKPYGTEYRAMSNNWLDDKELRSFVWHATHEAAEAAERGYIDTLDLDYLVPRAIDGHDLVLAQRALDLLYIHGVRKI
jgi:hypothetical protein